MTIGIYALYWAQEDKVYIGQSQNIEQRFKEHIRKLKIRTHSNYKVQGMYDKYELPEFYLIEETSLERINEAEIYWTREFDSINTGLNIVEAGRVGFGYSSNNSKYTEYKILKVFALLSSRIKYTQSYVSSRVEISRSTVKGIYSGADHLWLRDKYPVRYERMVRSRTESYFSKHNRILKVFALLSSKKYYTNTEISNRLHVKLGIVEGISSGRTYKYLQVKYPERYRIMLFNKNRRSTSYPYILISPDGGIVEICSIPKFAKLHGLDVSSIYKLCKKLQKVHKGWTLA